MIADSEYTIIPYNHENQKYLFENATPTELSHEEVIFIESLIKETVKTIETKHKNSLNDNVNPDLTEKKNLQSYERQYVAVIGKSGHKLVWINFFCQNFLPKTWKTEVIQVFDGGPCFFNLKVNLTTNSVFDLHINGLANLPISTFREDTHEVPSSGQF